MLDGLLRALGVPADRIPDTMDQRAGLYRSLLAQMQLVVLLDNVRDERQVRPLLAESRHSRTIVVSRTSLSGLRGVWRLPLDVLPRYDSIGMIRSGVPRRAAAAPEECDRLAALCGDLPLALDITLRKLAILPDLSLSRLTTKLREPGRALNWLRVGDLSVRESLNSAYRSLPGPGRALLSHLVRLPFPYDASSAFRSQEEFVEELIEAGMLRRGRHPGGYRLPPLVRAFAFEADAATRGRRAGAAPPGRPGHRAAAGHRRRVLVRQLAAPATAHRPARR